MSNELNINGIVYNVMQINGQKIAEPANFFGPEASENGEVSHDKLAVKRSNLTVTPKTLIADLRQQPAGQLDGE